MAACILAGASKADAQCTQRMWLLGIDVPHIGGHAITYDTLRHRVVSFGGGNWNEGQYTDQTWVFDGAAWTRLFPLHSPPPCAERQNLAYDSTRDRVVKFGGFSQPSNRETWEFDGADWLQRSTVGPPVDSAFTMVYDAARHVTVLFGNTWSGETATATTWEWNGSVWTERLPAHTPATRDGFAMTYDAVRHRVVLYGGRSFTTPIVQLNDLWEWDGTDWTQRQIPGPPAPVAGNMVFDSTRNVVFMCGNTADLGFQNWAYDGASWTQVTEPVNNLCPIGSASLSMVYMSAIDKILATFPEENPVSAYSRSYVYGFGQAPVVFEHPIDLIVPIGGTLDESIGVTCVPGATNRWQFNGAPLSDFTSGQTGINGATSTELHIYGSTLTTARSGLYRCDVTSPCGSTSSNAANVTVTCEPQTQEFLFEPAPVTFTINFGGATYTFTFHLAGVARVLLDPSCNAAESPRVLHGSIQELDLRTEPPVIVLPDFLGGSASLNNARLLIGPDFGDPGHTAPVMRGPPSTLNFHQSAVEPDLQGSFGYNIGTLVGSMNLANLVFDPVDWNFSMVPRGVPTMTLPFTGTWTVDSGMGADDPTFTMQSTLHGRRFTRCGPADIATLGGFGLPDGQLTADDIILFLNAFFGGTVVLADFASLGGNPAPDGRLTADDVIVYLAAFFAGCP